RDCEAVRADHRHRPRGRGADRVRDVAGTADVALAPARARAVLGTLTFARRPPYGGVRLSHGRFRLGAGEPFEIGRQKVAERIDRWHALRSLIWHIGWSRDQQQ